MNLKMKFACLLMLFISISAMSQEAFLLNGTVTSQGDSQPVPGVNVVVLNSTNGTSTDFDGKYQLNVKSGDVLQFSSLGFTSQTVIVANQQTINVSLVVDANQLDEVVVIGYGTQKKSHLTGAISKVVNDDLDQIAVSRVDEALIGQVSGVNIQATNAEAGGAPTITIRGVGSVNANAGPALVVDGIVVDSEFLGNIDMNDVESFEVLKDAASAAIYGSEGSNGVIMITTKSGKEGPTKYSYQTYIGVKEAHGSDDYRKSVKDWAATELAATGSLSEETQYMQLLVATTGIDRDWQDVFFDGGTVQSHSFAARGGSKSTKFSASLKAIHDEGVVITDDYKSYTASLKLDTQLNDNLKFGIRATPSYTKQRRLPTSIHNPIRQSPWLPIYHTAETLQFISQTENGGDYQDVGIGDYFFEDHLVELDFDGDGSDTRPRTSGDSNPYQQYVEREHYDLNTKLNSSIYLNYKITENLTAKTSLGLTLENRKRTRWDGTNHHAGGAGRAQYTVGNRNRTKMINDNTLLYNLLLNDKHEISALAGMTIQKKTSEETITIGNGYSNDLLPNLNGATAIASFLDTNLEQTKLSYFGRVSYAFDDKYLVNASFRRDGSSVFGLNTKYGNFPAVSLGWNAHKENFLINSDVVSKLKFRVSYGLTGNDNFSILGAAQETNVWPYLSLLQATNAVSDGNILAGFSPSNIANLDLQWEANEEFNPAVDFGFFNNKITGSIDYYRRTSDKLLLDNPVSYVTGFQGGVVNLGEVENKGWEFELRTKNISKEKFSWSSTIIASTNQNKLLSFGDSNNALLEDTYGRNSQWINRVGEPLSSFWGYVVDEEAYDDTTFRINYVSNPWNRINGQADDTIVKDLNGDGLITDEDKTILGDPYPDLVYSFTNDFKFGSFDLSIMVQGSLGAQVNNIGDQYFFNWFGNRTRSGGEAQAVADGLVPNESFIQEKVLTSEVIASADYFSLRNVRFGYNMSDDYTSKLGVTGLRIYAAAQNLIYITADDYHGFNPEHVDGSNPRAYGSQRAGTPIFKTVSLGINIDF